MPAIELRPGFCVFAIMRAALDRNGAVLPFVCAMVLHELAHASAMLACGGKIRRLTLRFADLHMEAAGLGYRQEFLAALAGPLMNLACGAAFRVRWPAFAAYSLILGLYNLLPVWPLDGGRMMGCLLLERLPPASAERVNMIIGACVCGALLLAGAFWSIVRRAGLWPLGMAAYLTIRLVVLARRAEVEM